MAYRSALSALANLLRGCFVANLWDRGHTPPVGLLFTLEAPLMPGAAAASASSAREHVLRGHAPAISIGARLNPSPPLPLASLSETPAFPRFLPSRRPAQRTLWDGN